MFLLLVVESFSCWIIQLLNHSIAESFNCFTSIQWSYWYGKKPTLSKFDHQNQFTCSHPKVLTNDITHREKKNLSKFDCPVTLLVHYAFNCIMFCSTHFFPLQLWNFIKDKYKTMVHDIWCTLFTPYLIQLDVKRNHLSWSFVW